MKTLVLVCSMLLVVGTLRAADELEARVYKDAAGKTLPYRLLQPKNYDAKQSYPLVLFLHGAGERGTDNSKQTMHGVKLFTTEENRAKSPCFLAVPQCPNNEQWVSVPWGADSHTMPEKPSEPMRLALELVAALQKEFSVDAKRLYVTGLSMGGYGAWDCIQRNPQMFAAAVPVCGGADDTKGALIAKIPVWAFHGAKDTVVKTKRSQNIIAAMKAAGGDPKYTEVPNVGHNAWDEAYKQPTIEWLFAQKK
ncbi:MAG TPA: prolyl oligopeptidase family serine peptidase [Planctomycetota bacterium]